MATQVGRLAAFDGPFPISIFPFQFSHFHLPHRCRKNLADIFYTSRVIANSVPNFVAMAKGVGRGKMQLAVFDSSSRNPPYRRKNLAEISYASRIIANFVPNFVAMATGFNRGQPGANINVIIN